LGPLVVAQPDGSIAPGGVKAVIRLGHLGRFVVAEPQLSEEPGRGQPALSLLAERWMRLGLTAEVRVVGVFQLDRLSCPLGSVNQLAKGLKEWQFVRF
jgi:hypothetical protein